MAHVDPLEELSRIIDFEAFRTALVAALAYGDGAKGGRPHLPYCDAEGSGAGRAEHIADARMEYLIRDRLSWRRFLGLYQRVWVLTHAWDFQRAEFLIHRSKHKEACDGGSDWGSVRFHIDGFAPVFATM